MNTYLKNSILIIFITFICAVQYPAYAVKNCRRATEGSQAKSLNGQNTENFSPRNASSIDYNARLSNGDSFEIISSLQEYIIESAPIIIKKMFALRLSNFFLSSRNKNRLFYEVDTIGEFQQHEGNFTPPTYINKNPPAQELLELVRLLDLETLLKLPEAKTVRLDNVELVWSTPGSIGFSAHTMHIDLSSEVRVITTLDGLPTYIQSLNGDIFTPSDGDAVIITGYNSSAGRKGTYHGSPPPYLVNQQNRLFMVLTYKKKDLVSK